MNGLIEFEPGAAPPFRVQLKSGDQVADLTGSALFLSVLINDTCYPIHGILDTVDNVFWLDLNELEDFYVEGSQKGFLYITWPNTARPVSIGTVKLKTRRGCVWQPT